MMAVATSPASWCDVSRIPTHPPRRGAIQTKLVINEPGNAYEQKAERLSSEVMRMHDPQQSAQGLVRLQAGGIESGDLRRTEVSPTVDQALAAPGHPLDSATRAFMERRFGYEFSRVRVHSSVPAEQSAREVNAKAYTVGRDIVFGAGHFAPTTDTGRRLIAHELAHVVQQSGADGIGSGRTAAAASSIGNRIDGRGLAGPLRSSPLQIARAPSGDPSAVAREIEAAKTDLEHVKRVARDFLEELGRESRRGIGMSAGQVEDKLKKVIREGGPGAKKAQGLLDQVQQARKRNL